MKKIFVIQIVVLHFSVNSFSQNIIKQYIQLSRPEKLWVVSHFFIARKTADVIATSINQVEHYNIHFKLDGINNGGNLDAFRHAYSMAILSKKIGKKKALSLGKAHEKGNYIQFKKGKFEDGILPDYASTEMDLFNNLIGAEIGKIHAICSNDSIANIILMSIKNGDLRMLNIDKKGNYLNCKHEIIEFPLKRKAWFTARCVVPSNY